MSPQEFIHNHKLVKIGDMGIGIQHRDNDFPFISYYTDGGSSSSIIDLVHLFQFIGDDRVFKQLEELVNSL